LIVKTEAQRTAQRELFTSLNDTPKPVEDFVGAFCLIVAHFATIGFEGLISRDRRPVIGSPAQKPPPVAIDGWRALRSLL
jgi:hypothetical protein